MEIEVTEEEIAEAEDAAEEEEVETTTATTMATIGTTMVTTMEAPVSNHKSLLPICCPKELNNIGQGHPNKKLNFYKIIHITSRVAFIAA